MEADEMEPRTGNELRKMRDDLTAQMRADNSGWQSVVKMPEQIPDELAEPK
jgi:hypothetical protein